jgi:Carboxypeptidase regulatory-like domain
MRLLKASLSALLLLFLPLALASSPSGGTVTGKVTYTGTPPRPRPIDMAKEPACVKMHPERLTTEDVVTGPGDTLRNVVVYISSGPPDPTPVPATPVDFDQKGCHYATHVLVFRVGQDVSISNSDPLSHNIHPLAKLNREWNRIQLPDTPPFSYSYANAEIIPVKCNIHDWMRAYFVVLKTSHYAVTGEDGQFSLPDLPPGSYTVTAWQEVYGTHSQEITIAGGETQTVNFVFQAKR